MWGYGLVRDYWKGFRGKGRGEGGVFIGAKVECLMDLYFILLKK